MKTERDMTRIVRSWLETGADRLPDRVLDSVLEQLPLHHQRPPESPARRLPTMSTPFRVAAAALAVVLLTAIAIATLPPGNRVGNAPTPSSSLPVSSSPPAAAAPGWTTTGTMNEARADHTASLLPNGRVLVAGGGVYLRTLASADVYDSGSGTWTATESMIEGRSGQTATLLPDGTVLVAGGGYWVKSGQLYEYKWGLASAELYDYRSGTWTAIESMIEGRSGHTATLLPDGTVLVVGGRRSNGGAVSAELYDPRTGTWTATESMIVARGDGHTATLLPDGTVLVAEGASAELYDPSTGSWTATGNMSEARFNHTATLLGNGTVLVAGGHASGGLHSQALTSAELYDPASRLWTTTASMLAPDAYEATVLLPDGRVLVVGGWRGGFGGSASSAELYDPRSGSWTETGNHFATGTGSTATLLLDGTVLVAGGILQANSTSLDTAQLYNPR